MVQRITIDPSQISTDSIRLESDQSHYLSRVLRLGAGDRFIAQDGLGHQWSAILTERPDLAQIVEVLSTTSTPLPPLRLIAALPKGNGFDAVIRQTTELGVTHIYPVTTERTLLKPSVNKVARWNRIAKEASEQSERITVPEIAEPMPFRNCLAMLQPERSVAPSIASPVAQTMTQTAQKPSALYFICAARAADKKSNNHLLSRLLTHQQHFLSSEKLPSITIAIGPEGGWTTDEITVATTYDYEVVSLGSVILRAVTAPITALSLVAGARELLI